MFGFELHTYIPQAIAKTVMCDWTDTRHLYDTLHDPQCIPATGVLNSYPVTYVLACTTRTAVAGSACTGLRCPCRSSHYCCAPVASNGSECLLRTGYWFVMMPTVRLKSLTDLSSGKKSVSCFLHGLIISHLYCLQFQFFS